MTKFLALAALLLAIWLLPAGDARASYWTPVAGCVDNGSQNYSCDTTAHGLAMRQLGHNAYDGTSCSSYSSYGDHLWHVLDTSNASGTVLSSIARCGAAPTNVSGGYDVLAITVSVATVCAGWSGATQSCVSCSASGPALGNMAQQEGTPDSSGVYVSHLQSCSGGCEYVNNTTTASYSTFKIDGVTYVDVTGWIPSGSACTAGTPTTTTPPSDTDGDGTSDGKDGAPGDPGSQGTPDPTDTDPTCGGAGQPLCPDKTDGSDHTSTGGGDCTTPPSSTGDPILAQIAFQTWATRCAVQGKANGNPGPGSGGFGGTDMTATNSKLDAIKGDLDGIKDWATGALGSGHANDDTGLDVTADAAVTTHEIGDTSFDQTGFGWSRSCPAPPTATVFGQTLTFNTDILCNWLAIGGWFVLLITGWRCIQTVVNA